MKYHELKEVCRTAYVELSYSSRFVRIAMWHTIGKAVIDNNLKPDKIRSFAVAIEVEPSDLATAILFTEKYPNLDDFPHDKTISWSQIVEVFNAQIKEA